MTRLSCDGWWVQESFGRQPMRQLMLEFHSGRIIGTGIDVIGAFTLDGALEQGCVAMLNAISVGTQ